MSHQAVAWALDIPGLRGSIKLVLVALADRADAKGGSCHPGFRELERRASTSRRHVNDAIHELERIGAIKVHRAMAKDGKSRAVNRYQFEVGKAISIAKPNAKKGTTLVPPVIP